MPKPEKAEIHFISDARLVGQQKKQFLVEKLHALGPRPLYEFLREIEAGADIRERLERYAALPSSFIHANDGDQFLPAIFAIDGGRE